MEAQFKKAVQTVINKAWEDDQFRSALVRAPKSAIKGLTGLQIPSEVNIVFSDQTDKETIFINIKPQPDIDNMELSDEELDMVAGGEFIFQIIIPPPSMLTPILNTGAGGGW